MLSHFVLHLLVVGCEVVAQYDIKRAACERSIGEELNSKLCKSYKQELLMPVKEAAGEIILYLLWPFGIEPYALLFDLGNRVSVPSCPR